MLTSGFPAVTDSALKAKVLTTIKSLVSSRSPRGAGKCGWCLRSGRRRGYFQGDCGGEQIARTRRRGTSSMFHVNRRTFLGAAGVLALSGKVGSAAPSERVRVAVIGVRGRGTDLARFFT